MITPFIYCRACGLQCLTTMHPCRTRNCPLLVLQQLGYHLFCNIGSPGFLRASLFHIDYDEMWIDAGSCSVMKDVPAITIMVGTKQAMFSCFMVKFWSGRDQYPNPVLSVEIHALYSWSPQDFLDVFDREVQYHNTIAVIRSYYLRGSTLFI